MGRGRFLRAMCAIGVVVLSVLTAPPTVYASILGEDDRQPDTGQLPWTSAVGYVMRADAKNGVLSGIGTAFLVGPRVVLTNWHNVFGENGALNKGEWVYVAEGETSGRKVRILPHFQFTTITDGDLPLGPRSRQRDFIALILEEPLDYAPLAIAPPAPGDRNVTDVGGARYTMAGVSLTFDYDGATPRTIQSGCAFASLARNAQFPRAPGLIGHTCDVWPGHSGAPLVETTGGRTIVRAINVAQVYPETARDVYERRKHAGEIIPISLSNHINIAIPVTAAMVDLVRRANAFVKTLAPLEFQTAEPPSP